MGARVQDCHARCALARGGAVAAATEADDFTFTQRRNLACIYNNTRSSLKVLPWPLLTKLLILKREPQRAILYVESGHSCRRLSTSEFTRRNGRAVCVHKHMPSLPLSLSPSLPLVRARIHFDSSLPPRRKSVHQPGSAWLKRGRPLRAHLLRSHRSRRRKPAAVQTESELATMNKKQRWARAGHAKRIETDAFSSCAAVACHYPTFVLQMVPKRKPTRWILQTDPRGLKTDAPAYNAFGSCRRILQRNIWILQSIDAFPDQRLRRGRPERNTEDADRHDNLN
jgi:hypothetical protein